MDKPLSPAALATWSAFLEHSEWEVTPAELKGVAAALRAAADQVVPLHICGTNATRAQTRLGIRHKLLAIAAELEGGNE